MFTAKRKPEHAAVMSYATARVAPTLFATYAASPNMSSGLDVATTTRSISSAPTPACSSARAAAVAAISLRPSPGASRWRLRMPVRCVIHSSDVSTSSSSMSFVTRVGGAHEPALGAGARRGLKSS